ncbi:hypothetical protein B7494_g6668 [Chlorociboria aeruginascens]|nr:hypothetical protein B7494_g6668 [Chlorociboria aeruginascens]
MPDIRIDNVTGRVDGTANTLYLSSHSSTMFNVTVGDCISERAAKFQEISICHLEALQVIHYAQSGSFKEHHDWFGSYECIGYISGNMDNQNLIFFSYVDADCDGETEFPKIELLGSGRPFPEGDWYGSMYCEAKGSLKFKPEIGNAVFRENPSV